MLRSHRGYDIGALDLAVSIGEKFGAVPCFSAVTRLLVDLNRSPENPRRFSGISRGLPVPGKESIMRTYYWPYRREVESHIRHLCRAWGNVLHLSVHTFTPVLDEKERLADIGLLYDPSRGLESLFCRDWKRNLGRENPGFRVRLNYPYSGKSDGFTTYLRSVFGKGYLGIELEVNQKYALGRRAKWLQLQEEIVNSLALTIEEYKESRLKEGPERVKTRNIRYENC